MLRIVTDGAADILPQWAQEFGIDVIPVNILFGEKSYLQGTELDNEGFYKLVDETKRIPKTSQPSPHQFVEFYRKIAQKGDTILSIHITAKLSGTYRARGPCPRGYCQACPACNAPGVQTKHRAHTGLHVRGLTFALQRAL